MSIFDHKRLTDTTFKLDIERMRQGWYTDKYFTNISQMLKVLAEQNYIYAGNRRTYQTEFVCRGDCLRRSGSGDAVVYPPSRADDCGGGG